MLSTAPYAIHGVHAGLGALRPDAGDSAALKTASKLLGGGLAGGVMEVLTLPIDKCRVYTQAVVNPKTGHTFSTVQALEAMWAAGARTWYAGAVPAFTRKGLIKGVQYFVLLEMVALLKGRARAEWQAERQETERKRRLASEAAARAAADAAAEKRMKIKWA